MKKYNLSALFVSVLLLGTIANAAPLTPAEIAQIESDLEIVLDDATASNLAVIVKPDAPDAWHTNAMAEIEQIRKADLELILRDRWGHPIPSAQVEIRQKHKKFHFGGVLSRFYFNTPSSSNDQHYQRLALKFFDASGLANGLKMKLNAGGSHLSEFFEWNQTNGISARGHLLIWPGNNGGGHLPSNVSSIIQDIYDTATTNQDGTVEYDEQLKQDLREASYYMVTNWASRWPVYEWDVYNEPYGNHEIQEILDDYPMAGTWFRMAWSNAVNAECGLFINDNRMVSAQSARQYSSRTTVYKRYIDELVASNAPISGIGFQARFKFHLSSQGGPQLITDRLDDFENRYGLNMAGTEFHLPTVAGSFEPTEQERAAMTEEIMTAFFSHSRVTGLHSWVFQSSTSNQGPLLNSDWSVPLNGLVWYYLNRIKYATHTNLQTTVDGKISLRAFKGEYEIIVRSGTNEYVETLYLDNPTNALVSTDLPSPDSDGDGLPDAYENLYTNLSPTNPNDGMADPDHDGLCSRYEYAAGTNPFEAPAQPEETPFFILPVPGSTIQIHLSRREGIEDQQFIFYLKHSTNLQNWVTFNPENPASIGFSLDGAETNTTSDAYGQIFKESYRLSAPDRYGYFQLDLK